MGPLAGALWLSGLILACGLIVAAIALWPRRDRVPFELGEPMPDVPTEVYVIWGWPRLGRRPVYVGYGTDHRVRLDQHENGAWGKPPAWWWPMVDTTRPPTVELWPSRLAAKQRETYLIKMMVPLGNRAENEGRGVTEEWMHRRLAA